MISVKEAKENVLSKVKPLGSVAIKIEASAGMVLADDVVSKIDMPPFDQSAMDGYAVCGLDCGTYNQVGEVKAGDSDNPSMNQGECVRIFTGAPVPAAANAVVMQEKTTVSGSSVTINGPVADRENIRPKAEQIKKGSVGIRSGTEITAGGVGFLATMGYNEVPVLRKPNVAVVATGNELAKPGTDLKYGQIYESNSFTLLSALLEFGVEATACNATDTYETTKEVLDGLLDEHDMLIITGGISVGDYDFVGKALLDLGVEQVFHKVAQKPGKPIFFGKLNEKLIFALPGNPAASLTCYYEYVYPAIRKLLGYTNCELQVQQMQLENEVKCRGERAYFLKATAVSGKVTALHSQSSAMLSSFAAANAIIFVPADVQQIEPGAMVEVHLLPNY